MAFFSLTRTTFWWRVGKNGAIKQASYENSARKSTNHRQSAVCGCGCSFSIITFTTNYTFKYKYRRSGAINSESFFVHASAAVFSLKNGGAARRRSFQLTIHTKSRNSTTFLEAVAAGIRPHLTERRKWTKQQLQLQVGHLVLVVDNNSPRGQWPLGRVVETIPSKADGVVRQVKVHITTAKHHLTRPIAKLCLLTTGKELRQPTGNIEDRPEKVKLVKDIVKSDTQLLLKQEVRLKAEETRPSTINIDTKPEN